MVKVSVIIPVYNVENYLERCLNSVLNQTYKDIEIILVNDGSTDSSGEICDKYGNKDKRIKVINNSNHGVSYSRNCGIRVATGEYVLFVDSDDTIESNYIWILVNANKFNNYDLILCNICDVYMNKKNVRYKEFFTLTNDFCNDYYKLVNILRVPFVKLYKLNIIKKYNIVFPEDISAGEDQIFNFNYYNFVKKYKFVDKALYNYFHRDNYSLSKQITIETFNQVIKVLTLEKNFLEQNNINNKEYVFSNEIINYIGAYVTLDNEKKNTYRDFKIRVNKLKEILSDWSKSFGKKRYIILICLKYNIFFPIYFYYILKNKLKRFSLC